MKMADVLYEFPEIKDPKTGRPLMERNILIANTSNMPVAARKLQFIQVSRLLSITGIWIRCFLMADPIKVAEAMREISSRLEEMPGEEAILLILQRDYQNSTNVQVNKSVIRKRRLYHGHRQFHLRVANSKPITQNTLRIVKSVLVASLMQNLHRETFPLNNWLNSYYYISTSSPEHRI